jgi:hypothetical protein
LALAGPGGKLPLVKIEELREKPAALVLATVVALGCAGAASSGSPEDPAGGAGGGEEAGGRGGRAGNNGGTGGRGGRGGAGGGPSDREDAGAGARRDAATGREAGPPSPDASGPVPDAGAPPVEGDCTRWIGAGPTSQWVYPDGQGRLAYKAWNAGGDRIMDFSHAGYRGGGVRLPVVPAAVTLSPSGGDDTAAIQGALDMVGRRPLAGGFRGAVELKAGTYQLGGQLRLTTSGVVLRGAGSGMGGSELRFTGAARRVMFMTGTGARALDMGSAAAITDEYVPAGSRTFTVDRPTGFAVGDGVMVGRPVTPAWISLLGMDKLVRNGSPQTWITPGSVLRAERTITAIEGSRITVDVPYPDSFDARYVKPPGGSIVKFSFPGRITEVGLEGLRLVGSPRAAGNDFHFLEMSAVADAWVKDVVAHDFTSAVVIRDSAQRITLEDVMATHTPVEYFTAAAPSDFNIDGAQVFMHRGGSRGGNKIFYHSTAGGVMGPNVILGFVGSGMRSHVQPHMRWATGLLVDGTKLDDGNIEYINRGTAGSGHGWTMGWGVIWNSSASTIRAEQPEGAANWAIGNTGTRNGNGVFDSHGTAVIPKSLYLAQLCARLGSRAVAALGYE